MGDFAIRGQLSSKTISREELVTVVVLDNLPYCFQGHGIRVHLVGTHIVEGGGLRGVTLEVDKHRTVIQIVIFLPYSLCESFTS